MDQKTPKERKKLVMFQIEKTQKRFLKELLARKQMPSGINFAKPENLEAKC